MTQAIPSRALERLILEIKSEVRQTASYTGRESLKPEVYEAMMQVNREEFVRDGDRELAWGNYPLSIGQGQTISQPYIVALMTDMLEVDSDSCIILATIISLSNAATVVWGGRNRPPTTPSS